jgi:hypothetical protein
LPLIADITLNLAAIRHRSMILAAVQQRVPTM